MNLAWESCETLIQLKKNKRNRFILKYKIFQNYARGVLLIVFLLLPVETFVLEDILIVLFSNFPPETGAEGANAAVGAAAGGIATGVGTLGLFVISLQQKNQSKQNKY